MILVPPVLPSIVFFLTRGRRQSDFIPFTFELFAGTCGGRQSGTAYRYHRRWRYRGGIIGRTGARCR